MIAEKLSRKLTWINAQSFEDSNTSTHVPIGPHIERYVALSGIMTSLTSMVPCPSPLSKSTLYI